MDQTATILYLVQLHLPVVAMVVAHAQRAVLEIMAALAVPVVAAAAVRQHQLEVPETPQAFRPRKVTMVQILALAAPVAAAAVQMQPDQAQQEAQEPRHLLAEHP
jgi:hypothetical protein